jgi:hypothetical protein
MEVTKPIAAELVTLASAARLRVDQAEKKSRTQAALLVASEEELKRAREDQSLIHRAIAAATGVAGQLVSIDPRAKTATVLAPDPAPGPTDE